jgi:hypothetical protein
MTPLHNSYNNLGCWKLVRDSDLKLHVIYNSRVAYISAIILFLLCALFVGLLLHHLPSSSGKSLAVAIISATGVLTPGFMICYAKNQAEKGPLLTYNPSEDLLYVREPAAEIQGACQRVSFSSEHFKKHSEHYFEFNIVIDGERKKFLSSVSDSFRQLTRDINEMGFYVSRHTIKL